MVKEEITVRTQNELDNIPDDYEGIILIEFGDCCNPAVVIKGYKQSVVARKNSYVVARGNAHVEAWENTQPA